MTDYTQEAMNEVLKDKQSDTKSRKSRRRGKGSKGNKSDISQPGVPGTFNSGIQNPLLVNPLQVGVTAPVNGYDWNGYQPLYCNGIKFNAAGSTGTLVDNAFDTMVYPLYNNYLQMQLTNKVQFDEASLALAFEALGNALSLLFMGDSIIAINDNPNELNIGSTRLRRAYSPDVLDEHAQLKLRIEGLSCPPNLVKTIYWLFQAYKFNELPGSPILRNTWSGTFVADNPESQTSINNELTSATYAYAVKALDDSQPTLSLLSRMKPEWQILNLPAAKDRATVDEQFTTWWTNQGGFYKGGDSSNPEFRCPTVDATSDYTRYYLNTNTLDGGVYALSAIAAPVTTTPDSDNEDETATEYQWYPGWISPWDTDVNTIQNGLISNRTKVGTYVLAANDVIDGYLAGWNWSYYKALQNGNDAYVPNVGGLTGTQVAQYSSITNMQSSVTDFTQWLYNIAEVKVNPKSASMKNTKR